MGGRVKNRRTRDATASCGRVDFCEKCRVGYIAIAVTATLRLNGVGESPRGTRVPGKRGHSGFPGREDGRRSATAMN